jgi:hypothetical protein
MNDDFFQAIEASYKKYLTDGPRSSKKLGPVHSFIANALQMKLGNSYEIKSLGFGDNNELNFAGKYYDKDLDISVLKDGMPVSAIALKFVSTNYKQNGNNYFENMLGETANIKRNDLVYGQVIILRKEMPYYSSDKKKFTKIEVINDKDIKKYINLDKDNAELLYHKPDFVLVAFIDTGDVGIVKQKIQEGGKIVNIKDFRINKLLPLVKIRKMEREELKFSTETLDYIDSHGNFESFINAFVHSTKAAEYGKSIKIPAAEAVPDLQ